MTSERRPPGAEGRAGDAASGGRRSVLFLAGEYPPRPGGVGDYTALLATHLAAQGVRVRVLATRDAPSWPLVPESSASGLSVNRSAPTVWRWVDRWDWRCGRVVRAAVRAARADLVHVQYQPAAFDMAAAVCWLPGWVRRRCAGARTLVTFHDLRVPYLFPKAGPLRAAVRDRLLRGADAAVFTEIADWRAAAPVRPAGRYWIPIGSNLAVAPPPVFDRGRWRAAVGADDDTFLIVHLGFLNRSKGLETLLDALPLLGARGRRVRLLLVGAEAGATDPANRAYADAIARRLAAPAVRALVHRLPLVPPEAASGYLLAADAAAFPFVDGASLRRGSLLAALVHGLPTVSTRPGAGEWPLATPTRCRPSQDEFAATPVLRDGESVLLVPPGDAAALAAALARVADDAALRARLAAGGRALGEALAWPRIAAAHRALYTAMLG